MTLIYLLICLLYDTFLRIKAGNSLDVFGATLAGAPFVLIGHNKYISWGLTNTEIGVMDFYVEKVDHRDPTKYFYKGKRLRFLLVKRSW